LRIAASGYREAGYLPEAVINMLAFLGWHPSDHQELFSLEELINAFSLERVSKSGAKFDLDKAKWFNHQFLMRASSSEIEELIQSQIQDIHRGKGADYLNKVIDLMKEKVTFAYDILRAGSYFFERPENYDEKVRTKRWTVEVSAHLSLYAEDLSKSILLTSEQFESHLEQFATSHSINKGSLMQPLRWAVSGEAGGPPLFDVLSLLGSNEIIDRIGLVQNRFSANS
jgi:glutamyl-tRNA synthetase